MVEKDPKLVEIADAMRKLDEAEHRFLRSCGWENRAHGWTHPVYSKQPLTQWDAVMEARRRILREVLLGTGGPRA